MINEILQWMAILGLLFIVLYPPVKQFVQDFNNEEDEDYE